MSQPKEEILTPSLAHEVCLRTGSAATIEGSIARLGSHYVLGIKALDCRTGDELADEEVVANDKDHVLTALGRAATSLRKKLGESLATVQKYDVPLEDVTTHPSTPWRPTAGDIGRSTWTIMRTRFP